MKQRNAQYELIRVVAMILVIGVHTLANIPAQGAWDLWWNRVLTTLFFLCNGLFFMLSGRFALAKPVNGWEDLRAYYRKRVVGILAPALVYMGVRTVYDFGGNFPLRTMARQYLLNVLGGYASNEYWFLFSLLGMLLAAPMLSPFLQKAGKKELLAVLLLGFGYNTLSTYLPALGIPFGWNYNLGGYFLPFMLGYALERLVTTRREEGIVYFLGAVSFVLTVVQKYLGFIPGVHDRAPTYACMLCAAFLGLKRLYRPGKIADRVLLFVGRHSLGVYMLHAMVLTFLAGRLTVGGYLTKTAAVMALTAVISLAGAFVTDALAVRPLEKLLLRLSNTPKSVK